MVVDTCQLLAADDAGDCCPVQECAAAGGWLGCPDAYTPIYVRHWETKYLYERPHRQRRHELLPASQSFAHPEHGLLNHLDIEHHQTDRLNLAWAEERACSHTATAVQLLACQGARATHVSCLLPIGLLLILWAVSWESWAFIPHARLRLARLS